MSFIEAKTMAQTRILVVEDEIVVGLDIQNRLKSIGYEVPIVVTTGEEAVKKAGELHPDLILMDIVLKKTMNGIDAAEKIKALYDIPVIYLTAYADEDTLKKAKITEPYGYIIKPFALREIHSSIEMAIYKHNRERERKERERCLLTILKSIGDAVITTDRNSVITFMNPAFEKLTGCSHVDAIGKPLEKILSFIDEKNKKPIKIPLQKVIEEGEIVSLLDHAMLLSRDKGEIAVDIGIAPLRDEQKNITGTVITLYDSAERRKSEEQAKTAFKEKDTLLKEIHHRVKNNLQVISSLLNLQAGAIEDGAIVAIFKECQNRVRTIGLIHEKLYTSNETSRIDFKGYLQDLTGLLFSSYDITPNMISLKIEGQDIFLGLDMAIPCGLIVNELVSNSLRHAFPSQKERATEREVFVGLQKKPEGMCEIIVRDNGIGLPLTVDFHHPETFGLQLVATLAEQLEGKIELLRDQGTQFTIIFPSKD